MCRGKNPDLRTDPIDRIEQWIESGAIIGSQISVRSGGVEVISHSGSAVGYPQIDSSSIGRLYCAVKPVIAVCLAVGQTNGLFEYTDPVGKFLPCADSWRSSLTVKDLLTHNSRLPSTLPRLYDRSFSDTARIACNQEFLASDCNNNATYNASLNWHILGKIIESVFSSTISEVVREEISSPLKLESLSMALVNVDKFVPVHLKSRSEHYIEIPEPCLEVLGNRVNPANGGFSSAADLTTLYGDLLNSLSGQGVLLERPAVLELTETKATVDLFDLGKRKWGLGLQTDLPMRNIRGDWSQETFGHCGTAPQTTVICSMADAKRDVAFTIRFFSLDNRNDRRIAQIAQDISYAT